MSNLEDDIQEKNISLKNTVKFNKKIAIRIGYILFILLILIAIIYKTTLGYNKIYNGVHVNGVYVGGSTVDEAEAILTEYYQNLPKMSLDVYCDGEMSTITGAEILASFDSEKGAELAYSIGRMGNVFQKILSGIRYQILEEDVEFNINYERLKLDSKIDKLISKVGREVVQPSYVRDGDKLYITTGTSGIKVDEVDLVNKVIAKFNRMEKKPVYSYCTSVEPNNVDIEKIRTEVYKEVQDAKYKNDSGAFEVIPAVIGVDFDVEEGKKVAESVADLEGVQFSIDLMLTMPQATMEEVMSDLFKDELATFTTYYNVNEVQRSENVKLSADFINNTILMPGQEFSYNNTVGERSLERGFKVAKVYQGGEVVDGLGGGICQTSSTLYNAVLLADLDVTERKNHSLSVAYVKLGRDATVSYGTIDFKFKNNKKTPIKIETSVGGGVLTVKILGIKDNVNRTVDIRTETVNVRKYNERVIQDSTIPVGTTKIITTGKNGYTVKAYKVIKENDVVVEEKLLSTDTYAPIVQVKKVGVEPTPEGY